MVRKCVFCGSTRGNGERTYHKFPLKDKNLLRSWLQNMRLHFVFAPKKHHHLCSDHFEEKCFDKGIGKVCLYSGSIPTLFGDYKSVCVCCRAVKGQDKKSFHKFPLHNPELLRKWMASIKLKDFNPTENSLICDDHFDEKFLRKTGQHLLLKANAVPTLFVSSEDATCVETRESRSRSPDQVDDVHSNSTITQQRGTKRVSSELSTSPSKILSLYEENVASTNRFPVERRDEDAAAPTNSAGEIIDNPVCGRIPETSMTVEKQVLRMKHDHQYELTPTTMRKRLREQRNKIQVLLKRSRTQRQHISRLKKKITTLEEIIMVKNVCTEMPMKNEV